jgi:hypothetical protein
MTISGSISRVVRASLEYHLLDVRALSSSRAEPIARVHSAHLLGRRAVVSAAGRPGLPQRKSSSRSSAVRARLRGNRLVGLGGENVDPSGENATQRWDLVIPASPTYAHRTRRQRRRRRSPRKPRATVRFPALRMRPKRQTSSIAGSTSERIRRPRPRRGTSAGESALAARSTRLSSCGATRISWTRR